VRPPAVAFGRLAAPEQLERAGHAAPGAGLLTRRQVAAFSLGVEADPQDLGARDAVDDDVVDLGQQREPAASRPWIA
jgi:hypothetical protein